MDLENAGGNWVDKEVHRCNAHNWPLITSRCPDDIPAFNDAILKRIKQLKCLLINKLHQNDKMPYLYEIILFSKSLNNFNINIFHKLNK